MGRKHLQHFPCLHWGLNMKGIVLARLELIVEMLVNITYVNFILKICIIIRQPSKIIFCVQVIPYRTTRVRNFQLTILTTTNGRRVRAPLSTGERGGTKSVIKGDWVIILIINIIIGLNKTVLDILLDFSNLNGKYTLLASEYTDQSIYWVSFNGPTSPLYKTRMMIRPLPASRPMDYINKPRVRNIA